MNAESHATTLKPSRIKPSQGNCSALAGRPWCVPTKSLGHVRFFFAEATTANILQCPWCGVYDARAAVQKPWGDVSVLASQDELSCTFIDTLRLSLLRSSLLGRIWT